MGGGDPSQRSFWTGLLRGFGGAIVFSLPLLMATQMWSLGLNAGRLQLVAFIAFSLPFIGGLSHYSGLRPTAGWVGDIADALVAYFIGFLTAAAILLLFGVVTFGMATRSFVGTVGLEAVPGAFGAVLAESQFGTSYQKQARQSRAGYGGALFLMSSGALYLALSVAPTNAMAAIAARINAPRACALAAFSILLLHAFVYRLQFEGHPIAHPGTPPWSLFLRFTLVGYAIVLLISAYTLWTFGRFTGDALATPVIESVVLAFPGAVGAAIARLLLMKRT